MGHSQTVLCSFLISLLLARLLFLEPANVFANSEFVIPIRASVCLESLEPSLPPIIARSLDEQKLLNHKCKRWSVFSGQTATFDALTFKNCPARDKAVNHFATTLFNSWGQLATAVRSTSLYDHPERSALTLVGDAESRIGSLIVWKGTGSRGGMIALVTEDNASNSAERSDLDKVRVLYPSWERCGELIETDAKKLSGHLKTNLEPKFLRFRYPTFYWNSWFEDKDDGSDVTRLIANKQYRYVIDLSSFDYKNYKNTSKEEARRPFFPPGASDANLDFQDYKIAVLPIGKFSVGSAEHFTVNVDKAKLKQVMTNPEVFKSASYSGLSDKIGALRVVPSGGRPSSSIGLRFLFSIAEPGCARFAVLVISDSQKKIVGSWLNSFWVGPTNDESDSDAEDSPAKDSCLEPDHNAEILEPTAIPKFEPPSRALQDSMSPLARLTFLDLDKYSIGYFEDLRPGKSQALTWVLRVRELKEQMNGFGKQIDAKIDREDYRIEADISRLHGLLFNCESHNANCPADGALHALREIADLPEYRNGVIETTFRDLNNNVYFLPFHLIKTNNGLLGDSLKIYQPLPLPVRKGKPLVDCQLGWFGGLIVADKTSLDLKWRQQWIKQLQGKGYFTLSEFRDDYLMVNLSRPKSAPEGLIILAHHGDGGLSDKEKPDDPFDKITHDEIQRTFGGSSFAVMSVCSTGSLGNAQKTNSELLLKLNANNIGAFILSPFKVPVPLAKRFLEHFRETITESKKQMTLAEVFHATRVKLKRSPVPEDTPRLKSIVDIFFLIGDGRINVCSPDNSGGML